MASFRKRGPYQWQAQVRKKGRSRPSLGFAALGLPVRQPLSPIPGLRGIGTSCPAGHPLQTKTFETRAEA
jgi:hypothetical protein